MKLMKLKMAAFGPYGEEQELNFSKFYGQKLFLITGNTGSGKTTIFDAICFALYGIVSGQKKEARTLRSSFAKPSQLCFVELEFESNGKPYRIRREPEQLVLKADGSGFLQKKHCAQLFMPDGQVKTNLKEISSLVSTQLVGFDRASFNKVAMLPQGQFQRLLSERGEQQLKTFRSIFETEFYEQIANGLFDYKQKIVKSFELFSRQNWKTVDLIVCNEFEFFKLKTNAIVNFSEIIKYIEQKNCFDKLNLNNCRLVLQNFETSLQKIEVKLQFLELHIQKKERFEKIQTELKILTQKRPEVEEIEKAEKLVKKIESLQFLKNFAEELSVDHEHKQKSLNDLKKQLESEHKKFDSACENFDKIPQIELALSGLQNELNGLSVVEKSLELVESIEAELKSYYEQLEQIDSNLKIEHNKNLMLQFKHEIEKKTSLAKNLNLLINLSLKKQQLEKQLINLKQVYDNRFTSFLKQQAFSLAVGLKEGQPCPVCGSLNHPKKVAKIDCKILDKSEVEKSKVDVSNCEADLQAVVGKLEAVAANLKASFDFDFKNLNLTDLKQHLKNCADDVGKLKLKFKNTVPKKFWTLTLNSDVDFEAEIEKLTRARENILASVAVLSKKKAEILKKIPANLQSLGSVESFKKAKLKNKNELVEKKDALTKAKVEAEKAVDVAKARAALAQLSLNEALNKKNEAMKKLNEGLSRCGFSLANFAAHLKNFEKTKQFLKESERIISQIEKLKLEEQALFNDLKKIENLNKQKLEKTKFKKTSLKERVKLMETELINRLAVNEQCLKTLKLAETEMNNLNEKFAAAKMLAEVAKGTRKRVGFERYVLCGFINEVLSFASAYLKKATNGRYVFSKLVFQNLEGLNFSVLDIYSGQVRDVSTLSGGETFMASLALCLGLRDVVASKAGANRLGTMLIDEGFGTLDESYLDSVVDCLKMLGGEESLIGIISHVDTLKHKIKTQIQVKQKSKETGACCQIKLV